MTQYVQFSDASETTIQTWFGGSQAAMNLSNYAEIADDDPRYLAWLVQRQILKDYAAAAGSPLSVRSSSTPALNGLYSIVPSMQAQITAESVYIQATGLQGSAKFTNGQATKMWPDSSGAYHTFTTVQFILFAEAVAEYVDALLTALATAQATTHPLVVPPQPVTIP